MFNVFLRTIFNNVRRSLQNSEKTCNFAHPNKKTKKNGDKEYSRIAANRLSGQW